MATLYDTGIACDICGNDPLLSSKNSAVWPGFMDADMGKKVCRNCRDAHYAQKRTTQYAGMYSELPIVVAQKKHY